MTKTNEDFSREDNAILAEIFSREIGLVSKETKDLVRQATCELLRDSLALGTEYGNEWIRHLGIDWDHGKGKPIRRKWKELPSAVQYLVKKIEGAVLVDLSSGQDLNGTKSICKLAKARVLIGVDLFRYTGKTENWIEDRESKLYEARPYERQTQFYPPNKKSRVVQVKADNLEAISRIPDGSNVHVGVNGFDWWVNKQMPYHRQLAFEINRALAVGSMVFGVNSEVLTLLKSGKFQENFKEIDFPEKEKAPRDEQAYILEKVR